MFWPLCSAKQRRWLLLGIFSVGVLGACSSSPQSRYENPRLSAAGGSLQAQLAARLAAEPVACAHYRSAYVAAFATNVEALSSDRSELKQQAQLQFAAARQALGSNDPEQLCSIPQCIIEPLPEGKLTSWCGYRVDGNVGDEVHRWFEWRTLAPTG